MGAGWQAGRQAGWLAADHEGPARCSLRARSWPLFIIIITHYYYLQLPAATMMAALWPDRSPRRVSSPGRSPCLRPSGPPSAASPTASGSAPRPPTARTRVGACPWLCTMGLCLGKSPRAPSPSHLPARPPALHAGPAGLLDREGGAREPGYTHRSHAACCAMPYPPGGIKREHLVAYL